jgi:protocatechuate 3,4-dioxygenase beta subunit
MPRVTFRPGEKITLQGKLWDHEADRPLGGMTVKLQQYDPTTGAWDDVQSTTSDPNGVYTFTITLPDIEGTIRLRTYFPGTPEYKADASPPLTITVKRPKAARTMLSLQVAS